MRKLIYFFIPFLFFQCGSNQASLKHAARLVLEKGEIFKLEGNQFFIDTLIMNDGSALMLDNGMNKTLIRTNYFLFGKECVINGEGRPGRKGADGINDASAGYRQRVSTSTVSAAQGQTGGSGVDLTLFCRTVISKGRLTINLRGGNGGVGGAISNLATPNRPNNPGSYAMGGLGGDGGDLLFSYPRESEKEVAAAIAIQNEGGTSGNTRFSNQGRRIQAKDGRIEFVFLSN